MNFDATLSWAAAFKYLGPFNDHGIITARNILVYPILVRMGDRRKSKTLEFYPRSR